MAEQADYLQREIFGGSDDEDLSSEDGAACYSFTALITTKASAASQTSAPVSRRREGAHFLQQPLVLALKMATTKTKNHHDLCLPSLKSPCLLASRANHGANVARGIRRHRRRKTTYLPMNPL